MRYFADGTMIRGGILSGSMRIFLLILLVAFVVGVIRHIGMMFRIRKAIRTGDIDKLAMKRPYGRMFMMRGELSEDRAAGIVIRSLKKAGKTDDEVRTTMAEKYGYSVLKTDALLLTPLGGQGKS